ncbi:uncharacterized protein LOC125003438 [Mugil cephalus]|uniref:uncharacterized protein LOC125003438 n=1 Tax=Mugil cephalus TaxID=48193 RepID=UPI001FB6B109|nr:uncharacterized protein LOC125003438 [Mugil cephalus]
MKRPRLTTLTVQTGTTSQLDAASDFKFRLVGEGSEIKNASRRVDTTPDRRISKCADTGPCCHYIHSCPHYIHSCPHYIHSCRHYIHSCCHYIHSCPHYIHSCCHYIHSCCHYICVSRDYVHCNCWYHNRYRWHDCDQPCYDRDDSSHNNKLDKLKQHYDKHRCRSAPWDRVHGQPRHVPVQCCTLYSHIYGVEHRYSTGGPRARLDYCRGVAKSLVD